MKNYDEQGFLLMEALLLSLALISLSSVFVVYRLSGQMHIGNQSRIAALYLAQEQMAYVVEQGSRGALHAGQLPWLGAEEALSINRREYRSHTEAVMDEDKGFYRVKVVLAWEQLGEERSIELERLVRNVVPKERKRE